MRFQALLIVFAAAVAASAHQEHANRDTTADAPTWKRVVPTGADAPPWKRDDAPRMKRAEARAARVAARATATVADAPPW
ncbi:hypothetical protein C8F01DRAFT_497591 [Mycena amicta]|nr:hypothetical protein C8F01DRAFT_497591 [Mycena amicta]